MRNDKPCLSRYFLRLYRTLQITLSVTIAMTVSVAIADFSNGGFETGDLTDWTKTRFQNTGVTIATPVENTARSALGGYGVQGTSYDVTSVVSNAVTESQIDSNLPSSATMKFPKYGQKSAVVNRYLSSANSANTLRQTMTVGIGDIDPYDGKAHVRFAIAPVLDDGSHSANQQPYYFVNVENTTAGRTGNLFHTFKYANQPGVPWKNGNGTYKYTDWQLIDVAPGASALRVGDTVEVEVIASRCQPSGHAGYVYVDGVGAFIPDLSVVVYGPESANSNSNYTYTYVYRNGSSSAVSNSVLTIVTPTNVTYSSITANGASCTTPTAGTAGTITCDIGTLAKDATGTIEVTVHVNSGTSGSISHGNYNIRSDQTSALIGPLVLTTVTSGQSYIDLETSITDGAAAADWGDPVQYVLSVVNNGPASATNATVDFSIPTNFGSVTWTCVGTGSATCGASGSGAISDTVTIPAGDSVVYTIDGTIDAGAGSGTLMAIATATAGAGTTDNFSSNNTGVDTNQIGSLVSLTVNKSAAAAGSVLSVPSAINCGTACSTQTESFVQNSSVSLTAVAASGWRLTGWSGSGCSGISTCLPTLASSTSVTASFDCDTFHFGAACGSSCPGSGTCNNHGTCDSGTAGTGACTCSAGYGGSDCRLDTDGDNTPDDTDTDDDNDGIADGSDCASLDATKWRNQAYADADGDGIRDSTSTSAVACFGTTPPGGYVIVTNGPDNCLGLSNASQIDTDSDGQGNACDADDDNDSVADGSDCASLDATKWRNQAYPDADNDGVRETSSLGAVSCFGSTAPSGSTLATNGPDNCPTTSNSSQLNSDSDTLGDACDSDKDGDGIPNTTEGSGDLDGDSIPNDLDLDSDGDGINDSVEGSNDADNDGKPNFLDKDSDGDGIPDSVEGVVDTDNDGMPNYLDKDSDGDGMSDMIERALTEGFVSPAGTDTNGDGIDDAFDPTSSGSTATPVDTDNDGDPDYKDIDSDGDGVSDVTEAFDTNNDGIPDVTPSGVDADGDGVDDAFGSFTTPGAAPGYWRDSTNGKNACQPVSLTQKYNAAKRTANLIRQRTTDFSKKIEACGGASQKAARKASDKLYDRYMAMLDAQIGTSTLACAQNVCTVTSTADTVKELKQMARKLSQRQVSTKLQAIKQCHTPPSDEADNRKSSTDYLKDAIDALGALPETLTNC